MANDILLEAPDHSDFVVVQAPVLKLEGHDVLIDSSERRHNDTPYRRALVHDEADGLTINFANDYPGGVTLNGVTGITPKANATPIGLNILPAVAVHGDITFERKGFALVSGATPRITVSVDSELTGLHNLITQLTERVTALEKK